MTATNETSVADEWKNHLVDIYVAAGLTLERINCVEGFAFAPSFRAVGARAKMLELYELGLSEDEAEAALLRAARSKCEGARQMAYEALTGPVYAVPPATLRELEGRLRPAPAEEAVPGGEDGAEAGR